MSGRSVGPGERAVDRTEDEEDIDNEMEEVEEEVGELGSWWVPVCSGWRWRAVRGEGCLCASLQGSLERAEREVAVVWHRCGFVAGGEGEWGGWIGEAGEGEGPLSGGEAGVAGREVLTGEWFVGGQGG